MFVGVGILLSENSHFTIIAFFLAVQRFGVQTIPAFLMFYDGRLVRGGVLGAKPINLQRELAPPRLLLWEMNFRSQIQCVWRRAAARMRTGGQQPAVHHTAGAGRRRRCNTA